MGARAKGSSRLATDRVASTYPCCAGRVRLILLADLPRQRFNRRCPRCGQRWSILVTLMLRAEMAVHQLEWE